MLGLALFAMFAVVYAEHFGPPPPKEKEKDGDDQFKVKWGSEPNISLNLFASSRYPCFPPFFSVGGLGLGLGFWKYAATAFWLMKCPGKEDMASSLAFPDGWSTGGSKSSPTFLPRTVPAYKLR